MNTALVWLLISLPSPVTGYSAQPHAHTVAKFVDLAECQRVRQVIQEASPKPDPYFRHAFVTLKCVQARVVLG